MDLLFTDVVMPGPVRSPELARQARALLPDIEVLFTSGYTENAIVHGGRLDPGVHLLGKPHRREDLARKVRQLLTLRQQRVEARASPGRLPRPGEHPRAGAAQERASCACCSWRTTRTSAPRPIELMDMLGHSVLGVASAEEARAALAAEPFDLLFTDVSLPGMSGVDLAREAVRRRPGLSVIIASGIRRGASPGGPGQGARRDGAAQALRPHADREGARADADLALRPSRGAVHPSSGAFSSLAGT